MPDDKSPILGAVLCNSFEPRLVEGLEFIENVTAATQIEPIVVIGADVERTDIWRPITRNRYVNKGLPGALVSALLWAKSEPVVTLPLASLLHFKLTGLGLSALVSEYRSANETVIAKLDSEICPLIGCWSPNEASRVLAAVRNDEDFLSHIDFKAILVS